jgi:hypothetical protein
MMRSDRERAAAIRDHVRRVSEDARRLGLRGRLLRRLEADARRWIGEVLARPGVVNCAVIVSADPDGAAVTVKVFALEDPGAGGSPTLH